jgi:hypothetical protein
MILAILAAATTAAIAPPPTTERTPNLFHEPSYCRSVVEQEVARQNTAFHGVRPAAEYAVMRQIDGCGVPTPVGYHPSQAPAVADRAAKREDALSNRR